MVKKAPLKNLGGDSEVETKGILQFVKFIVRHHKSGAKKDRHLLCALLKGGSFLARLLIKKNIQ